jgi:hypothetical protein
MKRLASYLHSLFSTPASDVEDELMGAVDLSDSAYCFSLLAQHSWTSPIRLDRSALLR